MRDVAEQLPILKRGVEQIVPEPEFLKKLDRSVRENRPLRVKYGIDPTGIDVHLGHTVPLRKLRQFQDLGHTAVIIIGNYTALVGDPSGRDETRTQLTQQQVEANAQDYLTQVGRIIDLSKAEVHKNGDWFSKWTFLQVLDLTRHMTLGQISAREDFAKRIADQKPVICTSACIRSCRDGTRSRSRPTSSWEGPSNSSVCWSLGTSSSLRGRSLKWP